MHRVNSYPRWKRFSAMVCSSIEESKGAGLAKPRTGNIPLTQVKTPNLPHGTLCSSSIALHKSPQLGFGNYKFREATIKTDAKLWKEPNNRLVETLESREMNGKFTVKLALVLEVA
jgi:hypothetical protein